MVAAQRVVSAEQRILLQNIRWETYESLLADDPERSGPRLTYDQGVLELMSPGPEHESVNRTISRVVWTVALELGIEIQDVGGMTYKRATLGRGFQPDSSYYLRSADNKIRARDIDPETDPPPDLVIEIDISRSSIPKLDLFAALRVSEVWRWDGDQVSFHQLSDGKYVAATHSRLIPPLTPELVTGFVTAIESLSNAAWHRSIVDWMRSL